jgi:hypothetical protein
MFNRLDPYPNNRFRIEWRVHSICEHQLKNPINKRPQNVWIDDRTYFSLQKPLSRSIERMRTDEPCKEKEQWHMEGIDQQVELLKCWEMREGAE